jgi:hypothetical protein
MPSGVNTTLNLPATLGQGAAILMKSNPRGTTLFRTYLDGTGNDQGLFVTTDTNANSYISGIYGGQAANVYYSNLSNTANIIPSSNVYFPTTTQLGGFLIRSYDNGVPAWRTYVSNLTTNSTNMASVAVDPNSNVYVCGTYGASGAANVYYSNSANVANIITSTVGFPSNSGNNAYMLRLDATGNVICNGYITSSGGTSLSANAIAIDSTSNIYMAGSCGSTASNIYSNTNTLSPLYLTGGPGLGAAYVVKFFGNGTANWSGTLYGTSTGTYGTATAVDAGGNAFVSGIYSGTTNIYANNTINILSLPIPAASTAGFVVRYTPSGAPNLRMAIDGLGTETVTDITTDPTYSNIFVSGSYGPQAANVYNNTAASSVYLPATSGGLLGGYVTRFDASGNPQWQVTISGSSAVNVISITTDASQNSYISGTYGPGAVTIFDTIGSATGLPPQTTTSGFSVKLDVNGRIVFANST